MSEGYVTEIGYTFGYYRELSPAWMQLPFLSNGLVAPVVSTACELGFGQGVSMAIHAATSRIDWYGTDVNPSHASFASELTAGFSPSAHIYAESFGEFCDRTDLPDFDYIVLHGVWSWISEKNRRLIVKFLRRKLKPGGVTYVSYNTEAGWAPLIPLRNVLTRHCKFSGTSGSGAVARIDAALEFAEKIFATKPLYLSLNPSTIPTVKKLMEESRAYVAHEWFNRDWNPTNFADVGEALEEAGLTYAGPARYQDHTPALLRTDEQQRVLAEFPDPVLQELASDLMTACRFRQDYWVKGPRRLTILEQSEVLQTIEIVLATPRGAVTLDVDGRVGPVSLRPEIYNPILDCLADHQVHTFGEIIRTLGGSGLRPSQILQAVMILCSKNDVCVVQPGAARPKDAGSTRRLNERLIRYSRSRNDFRFLASPLIGGGIAVGRFEQFYLASIAAGQTDPVAWAAYAWLVLSSQGEKLVIDGKPLSEDEANRDELIRQAREFASTRLPVLKTLGIAQLP